MDKNKWIKSFNEHTVKEQIRYEFEQLLPHVIGYNPERKQQVKLLNKVTIEKRKKCLRKGSQYRIIDMTYCVEYGKYWFIIEPKDDPKSMGYSIWLYADEFEIINEK